MDAYNPWNNCVEVLSLEDEFDERMGLDGSEGLTIQDAPDEDDAPFDEHHPLFFAKDYDSDDTDIRALLVNSERFGDFDDLPTFESMRTSRREWR
jgi:hypothetical protein